MEGKRQINSLLDYEVEENQGWLGFQLGGEHCGRGRFQGRNQKFRFGHVKYEIPMGHTSGKSE